MENNKEIELHFSILNLDTRASQKEVELAYNTLTGDKKTPIEHIKIYRNSYEYLMKNVFNVINEEEDILLTNEDEIYDTFIKCIPQKVKDSLENLEKITKVELSNKAKSLMATQKLNVPMLFNAIHENKRRIFGFRFWTSKDMHNIIHDACVEMIEYKDMTFELTYDHWVETDKILNIRSFVKGLKNTVCEDKKLTKKFKIKNTQFGIIGHVICDSNTCEALRNMLENKANQAVCNLSMTYGI